MSRGDINKAKTVATGAIIRTMPDKMPIHASRIVDYFQRAGAYLHTRYECSCNGMDRQGRVTGKAFIARTDKLEHSLLANAQLYGFSVVPDEAPSIALQRDPRGWPIILTLQGREYRLGGKS